MPDTDKPTLKILTSIRPDAETDTQDNDVRAHSPGRAKLRAKMRGMQAKRAIKTTARKSRADRADRLLRNTAIACALILTVMAFKNLDTPFTRKVTTAFHNLISMEISTEGGLSFVRSMMPESALVFLNIDPEDALPARGEIVHSWNAEQPWTEYQTAKNALARAVTAGTVQATAQDEQGNWTILMRHEDQSQAVYGFLRALEVETGEAVERAQPLGHTGEAARLYVEYRVGGESVDPSAFLSAQ